MFSILENLRYFFEKSLDLPVTPPHIMSITSMKEVNSNEDKRTGNPNRHQKNKHPLL